MCKKNLRPKVDIIWLDHLPEPDLAPVLSESQSQGFEFVAQLVEEYHSGVNRFGQTGEALLGVYHEGQLIAIGGLNRDHYRKTDDTGRVRHVYVLADWRGQGVGKLLMAHIIAEARRHFRLLTLRTFTAEADAFYQTLRFEMGTAYEGATHWLVLK